MEVTDENLSLLVQFYAVHSLYFKMVLWGESLLYFGVLILDPLGRDRTKDQSVTLCIIINPPSSPAGRKEVIIEQRRRLKGIFFLRKVSCLLMALSGRNTRSTRSILTTEMAPELKLRKNYRVIKNFCIKRK